MISKSKKMRALTSVLLVLAIFAFKIVDIHIYAHDKDSTIGSHCELCLLAHGQKQKQNLDLDLPVVYDFEITPPLEVHRATSFFSEYRKVTRFPFGKSLNKAPPAVIS